MTQRVEVVEVGDMRQAHDRNVYHGFVVALELRSQAQGVLFGNVYVAKVRNHSRHRHAGPFFQETEPRCKQGWTASEFMMT